jgi:hypothetical protein
MSGTTVNGPRPGSNPPVRRGQIPLSLEELAAREIIKSTLRDARAVCNNLCKRPIGLSATVAFEPANERIAIAFSDTVTDSGCTVLIAPGTDRGSIARCAWHALYDLRSRDGTGTWQTAQLGRLGDLT